MSIISPNNLIATIESYLSPSVSVSTSVSNGPSLPALDLITTSTLTKLKNLGPARIKDMRTLGQSKQIVSHMPIVATPQACARSNDSLHAAIYLHADKYAALALLPSAKGGGQDAARELQRCVAKYRFVGGVVGLQHQSGGEGCSIDGSYEELWAMAVKFRVPIALREIWPVGSELSDYQANLAGTVLAPLATHFHTTHTSSPLPILHLYLASVFDRHPSLRLILAHPGLLPALLPRIETLLAHIPCTDKPKRPFLDVWQHNFYLTTVDVLDMSSMRTLLEQTPMDRILYASNYPFEERGGELMEELRQSGFLSTEEWERVAWVNAEELFSPRGGKMIKVITSR